MVFPPLFTIFQYIITFQYIKNIDHVGYFKCLVPRFVTAQLDSSLIQANAKVTPPSPPFRDPVGSSRQGPSKESARFSKISFENSHAKCSVRTIINMRISAGSPQFFKISLGKNQKRLSTKDSRRFRKTRYTSAGIKQSFRIPKAQELCTGYKKLVLDMTRNKHRSWSP